MTENGCGQVATAHFFEGVEKLLEVWFATPDVNNGHNRSDLRNISRQKWDDLLTLAKCEVISFSQNKRIDAYVLSESSMFVSERRWILKTCGSTTPLQCLRPLLELAAKQGFVQVEELFYSRKNFCRPELQVAPHEGFGAEVALLDNIFENGRSYCLGAMGKDCWYLYTYAAHSNVEKRLNGHSAHVKQEPDQTIEILMTDLDAHAMAAFTKENSATAAEATDKIGIRKIIPNMLIDDYLFDPCGYSMNGLTKDGQYMTIHVTPEKDFSYVSFESNVSLPNYAALIGQVLKSFNPASFTITIFANKASPAYDSLQDFQCKDVLSKWRRTSMERCNFTSYNLIFAQYKVC